MLWIGPMLVSDSWYKALDADTKALVTKAAKSSSFLDCFVRSQ